MRRLISLTLSLVLLFLSLVSLTSCQSPTYMTIGDQEVSYDVVKSFVKTHLSVYTEEELKDEAIRNTVRENVMRDLRMAFVILQVASELGVVLTPDVKDIIEEELDYYRGLGDTYDALLAEQHATDEVFEMLLTINAYDDLVFDALTEGGALGDDRFSATNEVVDADLQKGDWYAAEYVVLYFDDVNRASRLEAINKVRTDVLAGSSFREATADIKKLYPSEFYLTSDGCFTSSIYSEDFENAVKSLKVGEVGEVISSYTSDGYPCFMLIKRLEISDAYVDAEYNTVISYYLAREYASFMEERAETLTVEIAEDYRGTDILDIE